MTKQIHGEAIPFHVVHELSDSPPIPCEFKIGDKVIFTNDAGLKWTQTVRAFAKKVTSWGAFVYVFPDNSSWWFPVRPETLTKI